MENANISAGTSTTTPATAPVITSANAPVNASEVVPAVSIVVPCYNVENYVRQTLDSLSAQTLANIEIICINDGSTDSTLEVLKEYQSQDSRFVIIDKPNGGYGCAMNVGMAAATGEYIGIVESDDFVDEKMFETLYSAATKNNLEFVKSDFIKFWTEKDGSLLTKYEKLTPKSAYYNVVLNPSENLDLFNAQMLNWAGIYKAEFLREHNIRHNESPGASYQDNGFWFQVFCFAHRGMFLPEAFYHYRQDNSASSINQNNKVFCMPDEYAFIRQFLRDNPDLEKQFIGIYHYKKMHNLGFAFSLLADQFQMPFLERYASEYKEAKERGELDESLFYPDEWKHIHEIMDDPQGFRDEYNKTKKSPEYKRDYELARAKGKGAAAMFVLRHDGLKAMLGKTVRSLKH